MEYTINRELAEERGLSEETITAIREVGERLSRILNRPSMYLNPEDVPEIVSAHEYVLQMLWGFPLDASHHRYQLSIEGCTCADLMDNENYTHGMFWVSQDCPIHNSDNT